MLNEDFISTFLINYGFWKVFHYHLTKIQSLKNSMRSILTLIFPLQHVFFSYFGILDIDGIDQHVEYNFEKSEQTLRKQKNLF